jgi:hypothetical protein
MAESRSFSAVTTATAPARMPVKPRGLSPGTLNSARPVRHRLRAVDPGEIVPRGAVGPIEVTEFLAPGATWLPAPQHDVPGRAGRPPMLGYLVLVPAGQRPPDAADAVAAGPGTSGAATGPISVDPAERVARVAGRALDLTYLEFELLAHLVAHPHRVHSRDQLVTTVWGYGHVGDGRTVDVHVARLRRKLGAEHRRAIQTVRRVGYKYAP